MTHVRELSADVDLETLGFLEQRMFEDSCAAGLAGNQWWGLDAGCHHDDWSPYMGLPSEWSHGDRVEEEDEHEVRTVSLNVGSIAYICIARTQIYQT